ncbi:peptidylprolyl isomerase [Sphingomonas sp. AR_OL41]|uniref:peptidylprolyl isomerase n=1 Tax=Sphingomonas sp. AR_OL41 TaxID=3042729 RepID=UPI00248092FB|nr:peptidylprolyl isomerase [Sphingomonas sp. AR_OL41]MDH7972306.1 peptidylprolyl isomerase [Sphingomonas sp. AR_OL41]
MMAMRRLMVLGLGLMAASATAQTTPVATPSPVAVSTPAVPAAAPLPRVAIVTAAGRIVIELETQKAPATAANFLRYVDQRRLDGVSFYRDVKVAERFGFVQFGVMGDPKRILPPVKHEPTTLTGLKHFEGTISLARLAPGTGRGDFTISVGDQFGLDANPTQPGDNLGYATFGRVVEGMDVILAIFNAPVSPTATLLGTFKGEVPVAPVKVLTARRVPSGK